MQYPNDLAPDRTFRPGSSPAREVRLHQHDTSRRNIAVEEASAMTVELPDGACLASGRTTLRAGLRLATRIEKCLRRLLRRRRVKTEPVGRSTIYTPLCASM